MEEGEWEGRDDLVGLWEVEGEGETEGEFRALRLAE